MDTNSKIKEYFLCKERNVVYFLCKERNVVSLKEITLYMIKINCKALLCKIFELQGKNINFCECLGCAAGEQKGKI